MTAVKTHNQIRHLADNGLPVTSADVRRILDENARLREALERMLAWQDPVELCAPELGGFLTACYFARAALRSEEGETL